MRKNVILAFMVILSFTATDAFAGLKKDVVKDGKVEADYVAKAAGSATNLESFLNSVYSSPKFVNAKVVDNNGKDTGKRLSFFKADARDIASRKDLDGYMDQEVFNGYCKSIKGKVYRLAEDRHIWTCEVNNKVVTTMSYYVDWKFFGGEEAHIRYWVDSFATTLIIDYLVTMNNKMVATSKDITATMGAENVIMRDGSTHLSCWTEIANKSKSPFQVDPNTAHISIDGTEYKILVKSDTFEENPTVVINPGETRTIGTAASGYSFKPEDASKLEFTLSGVTFKNFTGYDFRTKYDAMKIALP